MRYALLADIHGNLEAFEAVLRDIDMSGGVDEMWCLGDIVGYGPDPAACIALLRRHRHLCVAGNHDWGAIGRIDTSDFNADAAAACRWTGRQLSQGDIEYLDGLSTVETRGDFTLVHASPREPLSEYIFAAATAAESFRHFDTRYCLVGHSHVPCLFELAGEECRRLDMPHVVSLGGNRCIINPGSVGQPRDGDPRAGYAICDEDTLSIRHRRVPYDIAATQRRIVECGLPPALAERLGGGR